jgi:hypothetical protein
MDNIINIKDIKRTNKRDKKEDINKFQPIYNENFQITEISNVDIESSIKTLEIMIVDFMYETGLDDIELVVEFIKKIKEKNIMEI